MIYKQPWLCCPQMDVDLDALAAGRGDGFAASVVEHGKGLLAAIAPDLRRARPLAPLFYWRLPRRYSREAVHYARIAGEPWQDVLLANVSYDLILNFGCSTAAIATPSGPVLARNLDWEPAPVMARASYRLDCHRRGEWQFTIAGWPASIGVVTGMSTRGFAFALNAVRSPERIPLHGYPMQIFLRHVLETATGYDHAFEMIKKQTLLSGGMITLVGTHNHERAVIERTPRLAVVREAKGDEPLVVTNSYRLFDDEVCGGDELFRVLRETSCGRFDRLSECLCPLEGQREVDDAELLFYLYDPAVRQSTTVHQVIARPANKVFNMYVPGELASA